VFFSGDFVADGVASFLERSRRGGCGSGCFVRCSEALAACQQVVELAPVQSLRLAQNLSVFVAQPADNYRLYFREAHSFCERLRWKIVVRFACVDLHVVLLSVTSKKLPDTACSDSCRYLPRPSLPNRTPGTLEVFVAAETPNCTKNIFRAHGR
jgi:hypothetical protein